jgi:four helix bundle protein
VNTDFNPPRLNSYRQLIAWQKAIELVADVYQATQDMPKNELYGLTSQLRRSAVSIPSNIAEGQGRATRGEFIQFLGHARGSLFELETQIAIAIQLGYISAETEGHLEAKATEVARIINGLMTSLGVGGRRTAP